jgi:D-alanyl-D-alanine carboxypeptidase
MKRHALKGMNMNRFFTANDGANAHLKCAKSGFVGSFGACRVLIAALLAALFAVFVCGCSHGVDGEPAGESEAAQAADAGDGEGAQGDEGGAVDADADVDADDAPDDSESKSVVDKDAWNMVLINSQNPLPDDFAAPELAQLEDGQSVDARVYSAVQQMLSAAEAAGYHPVICSSFRTWSKQEQLYQAKVDYYLDAGYAQADAEAAAAFWVARPGTSEHQAGLALDIVDADYQVLDEKQESTAVQKWLMENCADYGFILRYPTEKNSITGVGYEPWHYRYVGVEAAHEIMAQGVCLEEYLAQ